MGSSPSWAPGSVDRTCKQRVPARKPSAADHLLCERQGALDVPAPNHFYKLLRLQLERNGWIAIQDRAIQLVDMVDGLHYAALSDEAHDLDALSHELEGPVHWTIVNPDEWHDTPGTSLTLKAPLFLEPFGGFFQALENQVVQHELVHSPDTGIVNDLFGLGGSPASYFFEISMDARRCTHCLDEIFMGAA